MSMHMYPFESFEEEVTEILCSKGVGDKTAKELATMIADAAINWKNGQPALGQICVQ